MFRRAHRSWVLTSKGSSTRTDPQLLHHGGIPWTLLPPRRTFGYHLHRAQTRLCWWERPHLADFTVEYALMICPCGRVRWRVGAEISSWCWPDAEAEALRERAVGRELAVAG